MASKTERDAVFAPEFRADLAYWIATDRTVAMRVLSLVDDTMGTPFAGLGKPEPLKHELAGAWSRRINIEHRLVYRVYEDRIAFLGARYHY